MNNKVTYRQQFTRCGKQRCRKCREGGGHGPYWYAYWSENGRTVSKYIGIHLPADIEQTQQSAGEMVKELAPGIQVATPPTPHLRIYLLGQFRIERKNSHEWVAVDSRTWHRRRARALLGCLLSSPGRRMGREQVMELLWPDLDIDVAANRLNGAVHELRQILEPEIARPANSRMLRLERDILELADNTQIWIDAETFENLLKEANATSDPKQAEQLLEEANSLYKGNYLLEELYSEWAAPRRDALQRAWVGLLLNLTNLRVEQGAYAGALETLDRLRIADPANETALQRLMILLTQLDRRGEALQVYRQHVSMLQRDYESEPLPETTELYEALRQGHVPTLYAVRPAAITKDVDTPPQTTVASTQPTSASQEVSFSRPLFQPGRHNQSPLIGRDEDLETMRQVALAIEALPVQNEYGTENKDPLNRALQTVTSSSRARRPHFILLRGEAGIGKTRLAEEISLEAYTRGWAVAWSRSYEQEGTIPYHPWTELLRTLLPGATTLADLQTMTASPLASPMHVKLERLGALLPELIGTSTRPVPRPTPVLPHEQERLHLWEAASGLLGTLSKIHPLLLVLDDLHWTDESSLELLTYLTHHLQDQRIILIGTCRDGELAPQHKLHTLIADLCREQAIVTIAVNPLTHSQIDTLLAYLPKDAVQSIQTQAAGNPFFAEELARYVATSAHEPETISSQPQNKQPSELAISSLSYSRRTARNTITRSQRSLPEPIAAVLERRLSRLSSGCQILLSKAAVLGGSFELNQLLPMANEQDEDTILDLLEEALRAGLLTEEGTGAHITYHFWHPLIISHLYERLSAARRAQMHRRAAESIKTSHASSQPEKVAAAIVYHLTRGGGDPTHTAYYAEIAGNQAYTLAAYSEAQQYYLQALQALVNNRSSITEETDIHIQIQQITVQITTRHVLPNPLHLCTLLEHVAECSMVSGNYEEARHLYECILTIRTARDFFQQAYPTAIDGMSIEEQQQR
jgi:DNA-binding SARP family transcriptional activator